jgi:hypothetical protein
MFTDKERKLLRMALGEGAFDGEIDNAAVMLLRSLRSRAVTAEQIENVSSAPAETIYVEIPQSKPDYGLVVFPFGKKHRGELLKDIPPDYLMFQRNWIRSAPDIEKRWGDLADAIDEFLEQ